MMNMASGWVRSWRGVLGAAAVAGGILAALGLGSPAQGAAVESEAGALLGGGLDLSEGEIKAKADKLDYDDKKGIVEGRGHVIISKGGDELRADFVRVDLKTEQADAYGNVRLKRPTGEWTGSRVHYDFKNRIADIDDLTLNVPPYRVTAKETKKVSTNLFLAKEATVTSCTNDLKHLHYLVSADEFEVVPGDHLKGRGAVLRLGDVPVMYVPYWYRNLRDDIGYRFYPGYASDMGVFLLSAIRYRIDPGLTGMTHLDVRSERGVAVGQDFRWGGNNDGGKWYGKIKTYYASDDAPMDKADMADGTVIDQDRYRIRLDHTDNITDRDYILVQGNYLSDPDILEDFFEDEYRYSSLPENYVSYAHRGDTYTINGLLRARLNDFYSNVNRLPEASVDFQRQQIADSPIYYEGRTAAAFLEQVYAKKETPTGTVDTGEDYSAFRFDTVNMLYYPTKQFGFLNVIPRAGYRGTYYSATVDQEETVTTTTGTNALGESITQVVTGTNNVESDAVMRSLMELGLEVSYKAFATWEAADGRPMRHILEPYLNETFNPEPNVLPSDLYQFDAVDTLGELNQMKLGVRNKIQAKREGGPFSLVDIDAYTFLNFNRTGDENLAQKLYLDAETHPADKIRVDFDTQLDVDEGLEVFNTQLWLNQWSQWTSSFEYRFIKDTSSLFIADLTLHPVQNWSYNVFGRYEGEESRVEEVGGYIERGLDCLRFRTGFGFMPGYTRTDGKEIDDEWRVIVGLWMTGVSKNDDMNRYTR